jgi:hypothetical protein
MFGGDRADSAATAHNQPHIFEAKVRRRRILSARSHDPARRQSKNPLHPLRHMALMRETGGERDLRWRQFAGEQQALGALDAPTQHILMYREAHRARERRFQLRRANAGDTRDISEAKILIEMGFDEVDDLSLAAGGQAGLAPARSSGALRH